MRKLVLKMSISLDGCVCGPNGEAEWIFRTSSDDGAAWVVDTLRQAGLHAMGSRSYYDMAAFWPYADSPFAPPMNNIPKIVFSKTGLKPVTPQPHANKNNNTDQQSPKPTAAVLDSWANPEVASGGLAQEVTRLKAQPGSFILAHGGASFAQNLVASGLVDEYRLVIHPVALGDGPKLFSRLQRPIDLQLISATPFRSGAVGTVYQPSPAS